MNFSRRSLLQSFAGLSLATVLSREVFAQKKKKGEAAGGAEAALALAVPGVGLAAGISYQDDKTKVAKDLQAARGGCAFATQNCKNCVLYSALEAPVGGKKAGKCSVLPGMAVVENGWCVSWALKGGEKC